MNHAPNERPPAGCRPLIYPVPSNHGESYKVECKGRGFRKVLGTLPTRAECLTAFERYVQHGELPTPAKRGPKGPQKAARRPRSAVAKPPCPRAEPRAKAPADAIQKLKAMWAKSALV